MRIIKVAALGLAFGLLSAPVSMANETASNVDVASHHHHHHRIECHARNGRGMDFTARGNRFNRYQVQQRALNKCYRHGSRRCFLRGCHRI